MEIRDIVLTQETKKTTHGIKSAFPALKNSLTAQELILFSRALSGLMEGGVPIIRALDGLERASAKEGIKKILGEIQENIRRGVNLSESLERCGVFPEFYCQTLYGGEISGRVPQVLSELSKYLEKEQSLKRGIRDALVYPLFILAVGFMTMTVLTCFVLPRLKSVYEQFGTELPMITQIILGLSKAFIPASLVMLGSGTFFVLSMKKKGFSSSIFFQIPVMRDYFNAVVRVRFSRLLALLLESGISILEALSVVKKTFSDHKIQEEITVLRNSLASGGGFFACINQLRWLDSFSKMLIVTGEETGRLGPIFFQITRDSESELEDKIKIGVKLIEPILILLMGLSVGFVVIGTVLPIFDMSGVIH